MANGKHAVFCITGKNLVKQSLRSKLCSYDMYCSYYYTCNEKWTVFTVCGEILG